MYGKIVGLPENTVKGIFNVAKNFPELAENITQHAEAYDDIEDLFEDGYDFGDVVRTAGNYIGTTSLVAGGTVGDVGLHFAGGIADVGESLGLDLMQIESNIWDLKGDHAKAQAVREKMKVPDYIVTGKLKDAEDVLDKYSVAGSTLDRTAELGGYMASIWAGSTIGGVFGKTGASIGQGAVVIPNTAGKTFSEVYREHGTEVPQWAVLFKGIGSGVIEDRVERLGGFFGSTGATNKLTAGLMSRAKTGLGKALVMAGMNANDEGLEEVTGNILNYFLDNTIDYTSKLTGDNLQFAKKLDLEQMAEDYSFAFMSTLLMGGASDLGNITALGLSQDMNFKDAVNEYGKMKEQGLLQEIVESETTRAEKRLTKRKDKLEKMLKNGILPEYREVVQTQLDEVNEQLSQIKGEETTESNEPESENAFKKVFNKIKQGLPTRQAVQENLTEPKQMIPVANQQQEMYNNTESEVNANVENQRKHDRGRITQLFELLEGREGTNAKNNNGVLENKTTNAEVKQELINYANKYNKQTLNNQEQYYSNLIKNLGGNVVFYEFGKKNGFPGMSDTNTIYIDSKSGENIKNVFHHELVHFLRQNNNEIYVNEIKPIADEIANDGTFTGILGKYAESVGLDKVQSMTAELMAEEVIANISASLYGNLGDFYDASVPTVLKIKNALDKVISENSKMGSFSLPKNQISGQMQIGQQTQEIKVPQAQILEQEPMNEANMDNLLQEVDRQVAPVQQQPEVQQKVEQQKELPKKKKGYDSVLEEDTKTKIVSMDNKKKKKAQDKMSVKKLKEQIYTQFVNHNHLIDKLAEQTGNKNIKYWGDRYLSSISAGNYEIGVAQTNSLGERIGDSLDGIYDKAKKSKIPQEALDEFSALKAHTDRVDRGVGVFEGLTKLDAEIKINELIERYPEIEKYFKLLRKFDDNQLNLLIEQGFITQEQADKYRKLNPNHTPIMREFDFEETEDVKKRNKKNANKEVDDTTAEPDNPLKKAKGSSKNILAPKESMARRTLAIRNAIIQNNLMKEIAKTLDADLQGEVEIQSPDNIFDKDNSFLQRFKGEDGGTQHQGVYYENGKAHTFNISKEMYEALKKADTNTLLDKVGKVTKIQPLTKVFRDLHTTYDLTFGLITNPLKDFQDVILYSKDLSKFLKYLPKAFNEIKNDGEVLNQYLANGGLMNSYYDFEKGVLPTSKNKGIVKKVAGFVPNKMAELSESIELLPRLAEYMATLENAETRTRAEITEKL